MAGLGWNKFKRFWMAEELPRWFGLSVVLIYLGGLGAVGYIGVAQARRDSAVAYRESSTQAVKTLSHQLGALAALAQWRGDSPVGQGDPEQIDGDSSTSLTDAGVYQRALRTFASHLSVDSLRVLDGDRRVIASIHATEIGSTASTNQTGTWPPEAFVVTEVEAAGGSPAHRILRTPIYTASALSSSSPSPAKPADPMSQPLAPGAEDREVEVAGAQTPDAGSETDQPVESLTLFLEGMLPMRPRRPAQLSDYAGTIAMVLAACGALFAVHRGVRGQLRGMSRIANHLQLHSNRVKDDIMALRITDATDTATLAWNEVVEFLVELQGEVKRSRANNELYHVLERTAGHALGEALDALPDGVLYVGSDGRFQHVNATACHLLSWGRDDCKEATLQDAQSSGFGGRVLDVIRAAHDPGNGFEATFELIEMDETSSSYRIWVIPLQKANHEGECVVVVRDVSQQVRADRAREEFIAHVTHELRTPLTNIRAYAETLSSGMFDDPNVITECYNVITKETRRLSRLVEDMLSVSQMELGNIELRMDQVDLKVLLTDGTRDVRGLADEKGTDLQLVLPSKFEPIQGDRDKLAIVINNLLGNAIKYTPGGGTIIVGCQFAAGEVTLTFKDNGIGIADDDQARVFEKFQRADDPDVQKESGTGIGLYTAREIVRGHGGDISLMSKKGEGTTVIVRLPKEETRASSLSGAKGA